MKVVTAREQIQMLSPWRMAMPYKPKHFDMPIGEVESYRDIPEGRTDIDEDPHFRNDMTTNGILNPVLIHHNDTHAVIADGHHRLELAHELGMDHLPVRVKYQPELDGYKTIFGKPHAQHGPALRAWLGRTARVAMPWYHTSPHELEPGARLTPGGGSSQFEDWYDENSQQDRRKHVWVEQEPLFLKSWESEGGHAYEVEPDEEPKPWPTQSILGEGYTTPGATIKRKMGV